VVRAAARAASPPHAVTQRARAAIKPARPPFLSFPSKVWFTRPCAAPPRPNVAMLLGSGNTSSALQRAWRVTTTREHCQLSIDEPNARCPYADCSSRQGDHARSKCVSCRRLSGCERTADSFLCCQIIKRLSNFCGLSSTRCFAVSGLVSEQSLTVRCAGAVAVCSIQGRSFQVRPNLDRTLLCMRAPAGSARIDAHGRSSTCSSLTRRSLRKPFPSA
jgi:hypothetical protein